MTSADGDVSGCAQSEVDEPSKDVVQDVHEKESILPNAMWEQAQLLGTKTLENVRGLKNLGCSCFLNTVVQAAFFHNPLLFQSLLLPLHNRRVCEAMRGGQKYLPDVGVREIVEAADRLEGEVLQRRDQTLRPKQITDDKNPTVDDEQNNLSNISDNETQLHERTRTRHAAVSHKKEYCLACELSQSFEDCILPASYLRKYVKPQILSQAELQLHEDSTKSESSENPPTQPEPPRLPAVLQNALNARISAHNWATGDSASVATKPSVITTVSDQGKDENAGKYTLPACDIGARAWELVSLPLYGALCITASPDGSHPPPIFSDQESLSRGALFEILRVLLPRDLNHSLPSWLLDVDRTFAEPLSDTYRQRLADKFRAQNDTTRDRSGRPQLHSHTPKKLYRAFEAVAPSLADGEQQDSHECYSVMLHALDEAFADTFEYMRHSLEDDQSYKHRFNDSVPFISHVFEGSLISRRTCAHCGTSTENIETFKELSLQLSGLSNIYAESIPRLETLLRHYSAPEVLSQDERVHCSTCKQLRDATKQLALLRTPPILCLHFKRFEHVILGMGSNGDDSYDYDNMSGAEDDSEGGGRSSKRHARKKQRVQSFSQGGVRIKHQKINHAVDFPFRGLDISACSASNVFKNQDGEFAPIDSEDTLYDLLGIIEHIGSINSGHYIAYVRAPENGYGIALRPDRTGVEFRARGPYTWFKYDDQKVSRVTEEFVNRRKAYMLFYIRRSDLNRIGASSFISE